MVRTRWQWQPTGLAAVWSPVPVEDFCGPAAEERLRDLTWIGPRVIRHQEVVAGVMRHSPVLPVRVRDHLCVPG